MSGAELLMAATAISAMGRMQQGQDAKSRAEFDARLSERNAAIARDRAARRARDVRRAASARAASARVALAGTGARLEGTPLDVLGQMASDAELSALEGVHDGDVAAARHLTRASANRRRGSAARSQALFSAGSSLLRGFAR